MKMVMVAMAIMLTLALSVGISRATEPTPANDGLAFAGLNIKGDTGYLFKAGKLAAGVGTDLATWKNGLITLRAEVLFTDNVASNTKGIFAGFGPMINAPSLLKVLVVERGQIKS